MNQWKEAQKWERDWHGNCVNSLNEELKQLVYAEKMGLTYKVSAKTPYSFDLNGKSVLDMGSGPYSLLLKCDNFSRAIAFDPLMDEFPAWVRERYSSAGIGRFASKAEDFTEFKWLHERKPMIFDEVWIYNVLQHTENPEQIIKNALNLGKIVRIFEWLEVPLSPGHIQYLTRKNLDKWLGGQGKVEEVNRYGAVGTAYYGIFLGKHYAEK